jgi:hypothetical protein
MFMNEIFTEFLNQLVPVLLSLVLALVTAGAAFLGRKVSMFLDSKTKRAVVESAVSMVEQIGKALGSEEKFDRAKAIVVAILNEKGIKISDAEVQMLIEEAVNTFFAHYNEETGAE